jgi:hypothetical protein
LSYFVYLFIKYLKKKIDSQADIDDMGTDDSGGEEVDLLYDTALNCYYDPKNGTYYELNMN